MAILSNGKFYGFLCSAKETGRKLANGAKEYVENFVSGFAGHGWKIWEYVKGKWMLEIDSIRVRGQFTVFELLVSKIRAIIGAQTITQGCGKIKTVEISDDGTAYLITLEDEDMSFVEHDFIRCEEFAGGKRNYHVEIESVVGGVIRIPISEFEMDEGGFVQNTPKPGDDIVQFGNSSHDEKYIGRHSAIYMHADESAQPAIDVLDGIYSKDWSDCLKVRMGGDIPGSDGLKGLYCVNGMIKGTDEAGTVLYQFNPDGSGFIGKGSVKWDEEGFRFGEGVKLTWDNLDAEVKDNLKGDPGKDGEKGDPGEDGTPGKDGNDGKDGAPGKDGSDGLDGKPGVDANLLPWVEQWNKNTTEIGGEHVISPKMFSGTRDKVTERLTGIAMGRECITIGGEKRTGIFALVDDEVVFEIDPMNKTYKFIGQVVADSIDMKDCAHLASAVFRGDYMISQQGIDAQGKPSVQYDLFDPKELWQPNAPFTPNLLFNFNTGTGHLAAGKIIFNADGGIELNNVTINNSIASGAAHYSGTSLPTYLNVTSQYVISSLSTGGYTDLYVPTRAYGGKLDLKLNQAIEITVINMSSQVLSLGIHDTRMGTSRGKFDYFRSTVWTHPWPVSTETIKVDTVTVPQYYPVELIFIPLSVERASYQGTWLLKHPDSYQLFYHPNAVSFLQYDLVPVDAKPIIEKR